MQIGVLALQGAFIEHEQMLAKLGVSSFEIRCSDDLKKPFDGLIIHLRRLIAFGRQHRE